MTYLLYKEQDQLHVDTLLKVYHADAQCELPAVEYRDDSDTAMGKTHMGETTVEELSSILQDMTVPEYMSVDPLILGEAKEKLAAGEIQVLSENALPDLLGSPTEIAEEGSGDAPPWAFSDSDQV